VKENDDSWISNFGFSENLIDEWKKVGFNFLVPPEVFLSVWYRVCRETPVSGTEVEIFSKMLPIAAKRNDLDIQMRDIMINQAPDEWFE